MRYINNSGKRTQCFVWMVVGILLGQFSFGQHLFDVAQKELSVVQTASVRAHIRQVQGKMLLAEAGARKMSVPVALRKTPGLVLINEQSGQCATLSGFSARFPEAELTPLLLAELKQSVLGDAQEYTCVVVDDLSAETPTIESSKRISAVTDSVKLPVFKYGTRGNIKTAEVGDRRLVTVFRKKPSFIPVNPDDPVVRKKIEALEEARAYYAYTYRLPDDSLCTYDEAMASNLLKEGAQNITVGSSLILDLSMSGMTPQQQTASQYGAGLWGAQLVGTVPVSVNLSFAAMGDGILGGSYSPSAYLSNGVYYPSAIRNQMAGEDLGPSVTDIRIEFNTQYAFYFGTDMNAGSNTDYVTVLLHEMAHGLGFYDSIDSSTGGYEYGTGAYPLIYDTFLYYNGNRLTALSDSGRYAAIRSAALYFDGINAKSANSGSRIKLYAPTTYQSGSSVSHWDTSVSFTTFMKYAYTSPLHTIGTRKLGLMKDLGWSLASDTPSPPSAPAGVGASDDTYTDKVRITWSASSGATSYLIYRSTSSSSSSASQIGTATTSPYDDASAVAGTTYYYWAKASNSAGTSGFSNGDSGRRATLSIPDAPLIKNGYYSSTQNYLYWDAVPGASYYKVYRALTPFDTPESITSWQSSTQYVMTKPPSGTVYFYWVKSSSMSSDEYASAFSNMSYDSLEQVGVYRVTADGGTFSTYVATWLTSVEGYYSIQCLPDLPLPSWVTPVVILNGATEYSLDQNQTFASARVDRTIQYRVICSSNPSTSMRFWAVKEKTTSQSFGWSYSREFRFYQAPAEISLPVAPLSVSADDGFSTSYVMVSWPSSSGATSYSVYRSTSNSSSSASLLGNTSDTSYTDSGATPGVLYYYWVKASNSAGTSGFSSYNTGYRALSAPTGVSATDSSSDAVTVTWGSVTGASYYRVSRATSSGGSKTALGSWQTSLSYSDTSATAGTTYYYWVAAAVDSSGTRPSAYSSYDTGVRPTVTVPSAPSSVTASDGDSTSYVSVSWPSSSGATSYSVYRSTSSSSSSASLLGSTSSTSYTDSGATPGTLYYYWVTASNSAGTSGFSSSDTGYCALSAPTGVSASDSSSDAVTVTWGSVTGASYYRVYRATSSGGSKTALGSWQTSLSYSDASGTAGTTYYYWVRAWIYDYDYLLLGNVYPSAYSDYAIGVRVEPQPKENQQITFPVLPVKKYGDSDFSVEATASSGLTLTFSSSDTSVATIIGDKIHVVGAGTTAIIASQAGDDMYDPATNVSQVLTIEKASLTVTAKDQNKVAREAKVLDSTAYSVSGLIGGDTVVGITLSSPGTTASADVGVYLITPSSAQGEGLENYQIDYTDGNLTVTPSPYHVADLNKDGIIEYETELIRLFQLASSGTFHTANNTVDGYMPGSGVQEGIAHDSDFSPKDWSLNMRTELLRAIQIRNAGGYYRDETSIDGFGVNSNLVTYAPYLVIDVSGGTNAVNYPVSYLSEVPVDGWAEEYKTTKIILRRLPSQPLDTFVMGAPSDELGRTVYETNHLVSLTRRLYSGGCVYDVLPRSGTIGSAITSLTPTQTVLVAANAEISDASATGQTDSIRVSGDNNKIRMNGGLNYINIYGNSNTILGGTSNDTVFVFGDSNYVDLWKGDDFCYLNGVKNIVFGLWGSDVFEVYGSDNLCNGEDGSDSYYCINSAQNTLKNMEVTLSSPPAHPVLPLYSDMRAGVDSYFIGVFEITQKQWELVMGDRPSFFTNEACYASRPVECLSYNDAYEFVEKLKAKTGVVGIGLPTEAVWEYACRAGSNTAFNNGAVITNIAEDVSLNCLGRYRYNDGFVSGGTLPLADCPNGNGTARVGSYLPNAWGLYDMHGNVAEWCVDWFSPFGAEHVSNPIGRVSNQLERTIRGGNWSATASSCRSASRTYSAPNEGQSTCGVRLFLSSPFQ